MLETEGIVLPLGRAVAVRRDSKPGGAIDTTQVVLREATSFLTQPQLILWTAAAQGLPRAALLSKSGLEYAADEYDALVGLGVLVDLSLEPSQLLAAASKFRILPHSRVTVHLEHGVIVGHPEGDFVKLPAAVHEVYCMSGGTDSLAEAVRTIAGRASEIGSNDLDLIYPERLVGHVVLAMLPALAAGLASFSDC